MQPECRTSCAERTGRLVAWRIIIRNERHISCTIVQSAHGYISHFDHLDLSDSTLPFLPLHSTWIVNIIHMPSFHIAMINLGTGCLVKSQASAMRLLSATSRTTIVHVKFIHWSKISNGFSVGIRVYGKRKPQQKQRKSNVSFYGEVIGQDVRSELEE